MKLLLTSNGLTNKSISDALFELVGKKTEEISVVFIPTAANVQKGDKTWLIDNLIDLKKQNLKSIEIADISAVEEKIWRPKMEEADVLYFNGGSNFHLMEWINRSGLVELMPGLLKNKVYVGSSAGSMVACPRLDIKISQIVYEEDFDKKLDVPGLELVNFYFLPHFNMPDYNKLGERSIRNTCKDIQCKVYALDDNCALKVIDGEAEIISEGKWMIIN